MQNSKLKEKKLSVDRKFVYLSRMFGHRTRRKDAENYVVNMIWQKLLAQDCEIQPITQQIVFGADGKHYYIDLYFPSIKLAIECDEGQHKNLTDADGKRVEAVLNVLKEAEDVITPWKALSVQRSTETLEATFMRVKTYNVSYKDIVSQIDQIVAEAINRREAAERRNPGSTAWKDPSEEIDELRYQPVIELIAGQSPEFKSVASAYKLFQHNSVSTIQKGHFNLPNQSYTLWFPQAPRYTKDGSCEPTNNAGWMNIIQDDFSILEINIKKPDETSKAPTDNSLRLTFLKGKNDFGKDIYRFAGVYKYEKVNDKGRLYRRKARGIRWIKSEDNEQPIKIDLLD